MKTLLIILVVLIIGAIIYYFYNKNKNKIGSSDSLVDSGTIDSFLNTRDAVVFG